MEIVDILCKTADDLLSRPYLVVVEEENDKPIFSGSIGEKEDEASIYSHSDDDSETFCTPPASLTPTQEVSF